MAASLTESFRELCAQSTSSLTPPLPTQRKRKPRTSRTTLEQPTASTSSSSSAPPPSLEDEDSDPFLSEAYKIHHHISALLVQLQSIRRQYLSINSQPHPGAKGKAKERGFTEKERDEVDLQAKILLKRCLERVLALEREEEEGGGRKGKKSRAPAQPATSQRLLSLLLPPSVTSSLSLPFTSSSSSQATLLIKAHHASILFHLHRSLSNAGSIFSSLQEERIRRSTEASNRTLGAGLGSLLSSSGTGTASGTNGWGAGGAGRSGRTLVVPKAPVWKPELDVEGVEKESRLSEGDIQMFEKENSELLRGYDEHLDQITKTTQTLTQISTLQSLLSQSLLTQSETSSRLLLEAGQGVSDVRAGNKQLEKAKERGGSGRVMILTFLIGAAMALLFLDWMS